MSTKAEHLPLRQFKRLPAAKRAAVLRLQWEAPPPAERAKLKKLLGWKRTREETLAWARELIGSARLRPGGQVLEAVAEEVGVGERYLRRLLAGQDPSKPLRNGSNQAVEVALTHEPKAILHPHSNRRFIQQCPKCGIGHFVSDQDDRCPLTGGLSA